MKTDFTFLEMQRSKLITANIKIDLCINWESFDWKLKRLKNNQILTWPGQLDLPLCFAQQQWGGVVPMWFTITPGFGDSLQVLHIKIQKKIHKYKNTKIHLGLGIPHKWSNSILLFLLCLVSHLFRCINGFKVDDALDLVTFKLWLSSFNYRLHSSGWADLPKLSDLSCHASKSQWQWQCHSMLPCERWWSDLNSDLSLAFQSVVMQTLKCGLAGRKSIKFNKGPGNW